MKSVWEERLSFSEIKPLSKMYSLLVCVCLCFCLGLLHRRNGSVSISVAHCFSVTFGIIKSLLVSHIPRNMIINDKVLKYGCIQNKGLT